LIFRSLVPLFLAGHFGSRLVVTRECGNVDPGAIFTIKLSLQLRGTILPLTIGILASVDVRGSWCLISPFVPPFFFFFSPDPLACALPPLSPGCFWAYPETDIAVSGTNAFFRVPSPIKFSPLPRESTATGVHVQ